MKKTGLLVAFLVLHMYAFSQNSRAINEAPKEKAVGNYIKFNVQAGFLLNPSFTNVVREKRYQVYDKFSSENYSEKNAHTNTGFSIGLNLLLGKSKIIKHVLGLNYLHSKGEYSYSQSHSRPSGYYVASSYAKRGDYQSSIGFLNLMSGIRLKIVKGLSIEALGAINLQLYAVGKVTGYEKSTRTDPVYSPVTGRDSLVTTTDLNTYDNTLTHDLPTGKITTVSFTPRISYDFHIKEQSLGVYASYNMALGYVLRWCSFGVSWYPFNALR